MDELVRQYRREVLATDSSEAALHYFIAVARTGGNIPLELSIVSSLDYRIIADYVLQNPNSVLLYDLSIDEIVEQVEDSALDDLQRHFGVDPYQPPVDAHPSACYVGWNPVANEIVAVISTQREQIYEIFTYAFWYGLYEHRSPGSRFAMRGAWNPANAPQEEPPILETIEDNHPGIVHLFNRLEECRRIADEGWNDLAEAQEAELQENLTNTAEEIRETAMQHHMNWTYDELDAMPTLGVGQFSNRKIDTGQIRVWLSRMEQADGARFDHAVEVEIYNPPGGNWIMLAEYPSRPEDPDYGSVFWLDDEY